MAKEKEKPKPKKAGISTESSFLTGMLQASEEKLGEGTYMGEDVDQFVSGIPLPAFCLMYLLDSNIFPLSKLIGIAGAPQSNKSSLGFEMLRWFLACKGMAKIVENESGKISPVLIKSMLGQECFKRHVQIAQSASVDDAQKHLTFTSDYLKSNSKKDILLGMMLDSLTGSDTQEACEKLDKEGSTGRAFPLSALAWSNFFKSYCPKLTSWPTSLIMINHLKEKPNAMPGLPATKHTPGGSSQTYHAVLYLWLTRQMSAREQRMEMDIGGESVICPQEIRKLHLENNKSSMGTEGRAIPVDMIWYFDENNQQQTFWDWDASTARLLTAAQTAGEDNPDSKLYKLKNTTGIRAVKDIVDIKVAAKRYTSQKLGVEGVTASVLGRKIHSDPQMMKDLMTFFHIPNHPVWNNLPLLCTMRPLPTPLDKPVMSAKVVAESAPEPGNPLEPA